MRFEDELWGRVPRISCWDGHRPAYSFTSHPSSFAISCQLALLSTYRCFVFILRWQVRPFPRWMASESYCGRSARSVPSSTCAMTPSTIRWRPTRATASASRTPTLRRSCAISSCEITSCEISSSEIASCEISCRELRDLKLRVLLFLSLVRSYPLGACCSPSSKRQPPQL